MRGRAGGRRRRGRARERPAAAAASPAVRRGEPDPRQMGAGRDGPHRERAAPAAGPALGRSITRPSATRCARPARSRSTRRCLHERLDAFALRRARRSRHRAVRASRSPAARPRRPRSARRSTTSRCPRRPRSSCRPDLEAPQYDDRYNVSTASGLAARDATRPEDAATRSRRTRSPTRRSSRRATSAGSYVARRRSTRGTSRASSGSTRASCSRTSIRLRRHGNRLGGEPRRDAAGLPAQHDRQVRRPLLHDLQAREVPHAHRARHRARHRRHLHFEPRDGASADAKIDNSSPAAFAWALCRRIRGSTPNGSAG